MEVAILRALQVGDLLCAVPALRSLRARFAGARITLVGLPWAARFVERFPHYVDDFIAFPGFEGLPEQPCDAAAQHAFRETMHARAFDVLVQMHGDGRLTNGIAARLGAASLAGFHRAGSPPPSRDCMPYPEDEPEVRRLLALARFLGGPHLGEALEFPLNAGDEREMASVDGVAGLAPRRYICLHAGARDPARRWPAAAFARVGDALSTEFGLPVVLTGSAQERPITRAVASAMRAPAIDAAAPISLGGLAAIIARSRLVVTNDTGVSHLAAALRVPSVVIFRASDLRRWAPLDRARHASVWDPEGSRVDAVHSAARERLLAT